MSGVTRLSNPACLWGRLRGNVGVHARAVPKTTAPPPPHLRPLHIPAHSLVVREGIGAARGYVSCATPVAIAARTL
jgi:hypothetical protein